MTGSLHYDTHQIFEGLKTLKRWVSNSYSQDRLREAMLGDFGTAAGKWSAKGWINGKDVLIIGPGPGGRAHSSALVDFIEINRPFVVCLNADTYIPPEKIDVYAVCHYMRLMTELDRYTNCRSSILMPYGILPNAMKTKVSQLSILDYGIQVKQNTFEMKETNCTIPGFLVAPYVLSAVTIGGARRIFLAGFDGYGPGDPRQEEMIEVINLYKSQAKSLQLIAITASTYNVEQTSVYCLMEQ
jgi:4-hydroxy 2-oxovalerate aldolase